MARPRKYHYNEIRECKECKRLFVRHVINEKGATTGYYCGPTCRHIGIIKVRTENAGISVKPKARPNRVRGRRDIDTVTGPTDYERELWGMRCWKRT